MGWPDVARLSVHIQRVFSLTDAIAKLTRVLAPIVINLKVLPHVPRVNGHLAAEQALNAALAACRAQQSFCVLSKIIFKIHNHHPT